MEAVNTVRDRLQWGAQQPQERFNELPLDCREDGAMNASVRDADNAYSRENRPPVLLIVMALWNTYYAYNIQALSTSAPKVQVAILHNTLQQPMMPMTKAAVNFNAIPPYQFLTTILWLFYIIPGSSELDLPNPPLLMMVSAIYEQSKHYSHCVAFQPPARERPQYVASFVFVVLESMFYISESFGCESRNYSPVP